MIGLRRQIAPGGEVRPWLGLVLALALLSASAPALAEHCSEGAVVAAYLYNFAKFVEWPRSTWAAVDEPLIIGVVGTPKAAGELATSLHGRTVQGHPVMVWHVAGLAYARSCHLLWVDQLPAAAERQAIFDSLAGRPILTVGHEEAFAHSGGMISLFMEGDRLRFTINQAEASRSGLKISSKLLALAQRVETEGPR